MSFISIDDVKSVTASSFQLTIGDMSSPGRARRVARPRQVAMYLARKMTPRSLPEIGKHFGNRDHTTVLHAVRRVEALMLKDKMFADQVELLRGLLQRVRPDGIDVLSLASWVRLARLVRIPHVPIHFVADIAVEYLESDNARDPARIHHLAQLNRAIASTAQLDRTMQRWDHCAAVELQRPIVSSAAPRWLSEMIWPRHDDARMLARLGDLHGAATVAVWRRPWVTIQREYRVFVVAGDVVAISNRYPDRPIAPGPRVTFELGLAKLYAEAIVRAATTPVLNPQVGAAGLPLDTVSCTLDFVATEKGVFLLDGGAPSTPAWGASPCCFVGREIKGVALASDRCVLPLPSATQRVAAGV